MYFDPTSMCQDWMMTIECIALQSVIVSKPQWYTTECTLARLWFLRSTWMPKVLTGGVTTMGESVYAYWQEEDCDQKTKQNKKTEAKGLTSSWRGCSRDWSLWYDALFQVCSVKQMHAHVYICMQTHTHTHAHMHARMHVRMHIHTHTHTHRVY